MTIRLLSLPKHMRLQRIFFFRPCILHKLKGLLAHSWQLLSRFSASHRFFNQAFNSIDIRLQWKYMWPNMSRNKHNSYQFSCWQKHVILLLGAKVLRVGSDFLQAHPSFMCANRIIKGRITKFALANGGFVWIKFSIVWGQLKLRSFMLKSTLQQ